MSPNISRVPICLLLEEAEKQILLSEPPKVQVIRITATPLLLTLCIQGNYLTFSTCSTPSLPHCRIAMKNLNTEKRKHPQISTTHIPVSPLIYLCYLTFICPGKKIGNRFSFAMPTPQQTVESNKANSREIQKQRTVECQ